MATYPEIPGIDEEGNFPDEVRTRIFQNFSVPGEPEFDYLEGRYGRRMVDYVTPRDFGAVLDGITDDSIPATAAFQYAATRNIPVVLTGRMRASVSLVDIPVVIRAEGSEWVQYPGESPLKIEHTLMGGDFGQAVSAVSSIWLVGSGDSDESSKYQPYSTITVSDSTLQQLALRQGDWLKLSCDDAYAGDYIGNGKKTWISEPVQVAGLALRSTLISGAGGISPDQEIVGQSSGAVAYVASARTEYGATDSLARTLMLNDVRGVFENGETILQGGTARGTVVSKMIATPILMNAGLINTAPVIHKYRELAVDIEGLRFVASGDIDSLQPASNRTPAMTLITTLDSSVRFHVKSAWRQGLRLESVVGLMVNDSRIDKLSGYAEDAMSGWGYGIEATGSTAYCSIFLTASNLRHAFSTNIRTSDTPPSQSATPEGARYQYRMAGVAAKIDVQGAFHNCTDAALDTHGGSLYIRFHNFRVTGSMSGGRTQARPTGVQNRSFGTIIEDFYIEDVPDGIRDISHFFPSPFPALRATTHIRRGVMRGITNYGIVGYQLASTDESKGFARTIIDSVDIGFAPLSNVGNAAPSKQCGVRYRGGRIEMNRVTARGLNDCYARFDGGPNGMKEVVIRDGLLDMSDSPNQAYGTFLAGGDIPLLVVEGWKVKVGPWSSPSIIRSNTAMPNTTLRTERCSAIDSSTTLAAISGTGGSLGTVAGMRNGGSRLRATATWDPPSIESKASATTTVAVAGASFGDVVTVSFSNGQAGGQLSGYVTSTGSVVVVLFNPTGSTIDLPSGTLLVIVDK